MSHADLRGPGDDPIALAVFDVAGTTVDVTGGVPRAFVAAFSAHDVALSESEVVAVRGVSKRSAIRTLLEAKAPERADSDLVEAVLDAFRSKLRDVYETQPIVALPGAASVIREFKERGVRVWLSTGFDRALAELVTERSGLAPLIDGLVTDDDVDRGRPDLEAASAARVGCSVRVLSGAHDREVLARFPHDLLLEDISTLPAELERLYR